jgi:hypothetical protein
MTQTEQGWQKVWAWFVTTESGFHICARVMRRSIHVPPIGGAFGGGGHVDYVYRDIQSYDE